MRVTMEQLVTSANEVLRVIEWRIQGLEAGNFANDVISDITLQQTSGILLCLKLLGLMPEEEEEKLQKRLMKAGRIKESPVLTQKQLIDYCNLHQPRWSCAACRHTKACNAYADKYFMVPADEEVVHPDRYTDEPIGGRDGEE